MTASLSYRGDVRTQSSVVRPWYYSRTSSVILSDCVHRDVPCADGCALLLSHVNQINMTREFPGLFDTVDQTDEEDILVLMARLGGVLRRPL